MLLQILQETSQYRIFDFLNQLSPKFFIRLGVNMLFIIALIRLIYFVHYRSREHVFTFYIFNLIIFLITYLLNKVEMSMGAAFGLFAVFSLLRFRTENVSTKDMTYMFLAIAIGLINAVGKGGWDELFIINLIVLLITYLLESKWLIRKEMSKKITYEKIELITPLRRSELIADLENRLGIKINFIQIGNMDLLKDSTTIRVFYYD